VVTIEPSTTTYPGPEGFDFIQISTGPFAKFAVIVPGPEIVAVVIGDMGPVTTIVGELDHVLNI
jgi:hypothetical protein